MPEDTTEQVPLTPAGPRAGGSVFPRAGESIGRFVVIEKLGEGGMGAVYAARDPVLNRKVAIKLLRRELSGDGHAARMVQEAQALARLSHPNVVSVHEFGIADGRMFLAMEHVEGEALSDVLREAPPWERVLELFLAAGEGLAAAHAAHLIHRDFKPQNVMVGRDGRVRVLDFGLARQAGAEVGSPSATTLPPVGGPHLTSPGAVLGTPSYMSPEQRAGETCDARTDQFSFCVSLWEGLYGELPFKRPRLGSDDTTPLASEPSQRALEPTPKRGGVPGRVHRALLRGLSLDREQRFPSMPALLDALRPPARRYPVALVYGLAALTAFITVAAVADQLQARTPRGWWARHKSRCNPVRVNAELREARSTGGALSPGKAGADLYTAACLALAGRFEQADTLATSLQPAERAEAARLFYRLGAPPEDQAGARLPEGQREMMALALKHSRPPTDEHAKAAYYVALAELEDGDTDGARAHLEYFLRLHLADDPWRRTAQEALTSLAP